MRANSQSFTKTKFKSNTGMHTTEMKAFRRKLREEARDIVRHFRDIEALIGKL